MLDPATRPRRTIPRAIVAAMITLPLLLAAPQTAGAAVVEVPEPPAAYDTLQDAATQIDGPWANNYLGAQTVSGDFTCDGITDIAMSGGSGVHVISGPIGGLPPLIDLDDPAAANGFLFANVGMIVGDDGVPFPVEGAEQLRAAGDVNGDGCDDLLAPYFYNYWFVVFGKAGNADVRIDPSLPNWLGSAGFRIVDPTPSTGTVDAAGAGDVNGDGLDDIVITDPREDTAYVVFGRTSTADVELSDLGSSGYPITADDAGSVSGAGDVNRDGKADVLLGSANRDGRAGERAGAAWVVFGKANTTPMDVTSLGPAGYRIEGGEAYQQIGQQVADGGDINGDRVPDQLIGRLSSDLDRGGVFVVFGKSSSTKTVRLDPSGFRGYQIIGPPGSQIGRNPSVGGFDANGDGRADQLIGSPTSDAGGRPGAGSEWVVYGKGAKRDIDLDSFTGGYRVDGPAAGAELGFRAATVPDAGGGVRAVVGAWHNSANGRYRPGSTFVVGEQSTLPPLNPPVTDVRYRTSPPAATICGSRRASQPSASVRIAVDRIATGRHTKAGRCAPGAPQRAVLRCQRLRAVLSRSVNVPATGRRAVTLRKPLTGGRYLVRMWATTAGGHTYGPYTATVSMPR